MITSNYFEDNKDINFILNHVIDWETIVPLRERGYHDANEYKKTNDEKFMYAPTTVEEALEGYAAIHTQYGEIAGKELAPVAQAMDKKGLIFENGKVTFPSEMVKVVDLLANSQLLGYTVRREYGGWNLPFAARASIMEMISRADSSMGLTVGCFTLADVIEAFASDELKNEYIPKMASGEMCGAMSLTEPDYGSDLPHLKTKAVKQEDGTYLLTGNKRFITHACGFEDRPSVILTLARSKGEGAKGLSFFLVETRDIEVTRIEEKLGIHCSPTCEISYDNSKAKLVGEEGKGLIKYAMAMMNGARLAIGMQSLGVSEAAYREAAKYAGERVQFGIAIENIPAVANILDNMQALIQGQRALVYRSSEIVDLYEGYYEEELEKGTEERAIRKVENVQKHDKLAKLLTPITKMFCSEISNQVASDGVQIFGGSGYTEEFDAARIFRDARITTIYEGTTQLQVLAIVGGVIDITRDKSIIKDFLLDEIKQIGIDKIEKLLTEELEQMVNLANSYKEIDKEKKDRLTQDLVFPFSWLVTSIFLAKHIKIAQEKDSEYAISKEKYFNVFHGISMAEQAKHAVYIKSAL